MFRSLSNSLSILECNQCIDRLDMRRNLSLCVQKIDPSVDTVLVSQVSEFCIYRLQMILRDINKHLNLHLSNMILKV
jgi:hypothetical protein